MKVKQLVQFFTKSEENKVNDDIWEMFSKKFGFVNNCSKMDILSVILELDSRISKLESPELPEVDNK